MPPRARSDMERYCSFAPFGNFDASMVDAIAALSSWVPLLWFTFGRYCSFAPANHVINAFWSAIAALLLWLLGPCRYCSFDIGSCKAPTSPWWYVRQCNEADHAPQDAIAAMSCENPAHGTGVGTYCFAVTPLMEPLLFNMMHIQCRSPSGPRSGFPSPAGRLVPHVLLAPSIPQLAGLPSRHFAKSAIQAICTAISEIRTLAAEDQSKGPVMSSLEPLTPQTFAPGDTR